MKYPAIALVFFALYAPEAQAASFDCAKASTKVEKTVCAYTQLSSLDEQLGESFQRARMLAADQQGFRNGQREWLREVRDACSDEICLNMAYRKRIGELTRFAARCDNEVKEILDTSLDIARKLPESDQGDAGGYQRFNTLRTGHASLRGDIAVAYAMAGCLPQIHGALDTISRLALRTATIIELVRELIRQGRLNEAEGLYSSADTQQKDKWGITKNTVEDGAFSLGEAFVLVGEIERGKEYLFSVNSRWNHLESPSYRFVQALLAANRLAEARDFLQELGTSDEHARNASRLVARYRVDQAIRSDMTEEAQHTLCQELHTFHLFEASQLCARLGDIQTALRLANGIDDEFARVQALIAVTQETPDLADTRNILAQAADISRRCTSDLCREYAAGTVAETYASKGMVRLAAALVTEAYGNEEAVAQAMQKVAIALLRQGDIDSVGKMYKDEPQPELAVAYGKVGDFANAFAGFRNSSNSFVAFEIAAAIATLPIPSGDIPQWLIIADRMDEKNRASIYQAMMAKLVRDGKMNEAGILLENLPPSLSRARALLGIAQGKLGIVPGEEWLKMVRVL